MKKLFFALFILASSISWADSLLPVFNKDLLTLEYSDKSAFGCEWSNLNKDRVAAFIQGRF